MPVPQEKRNAPASNKNSGLVLEMPQKGQSLAQNDLPSVC